MLAGTTVHVSAGETTCASNGVLTFCVYPTPFHRSEKYMVLSYTVDTQQPANVSFVATLALSRRHWILIELPAQLSGSFTIVPKTPPGTYMATAYLWQVDHALVQVQIPVRFGH